MFPLISSKIPSPTSTFSPSSTVSVLFSLSQIYKLIPLPDSSSIERISESTFGLKYNYSSSSDQKHPAGVVASYSSDTYYTEDALSKNYPAFQHIFFSVITR